MSHALSAPCLNVLLADDHPDITDSYAELLGAYGHRIRIAHDGLKAVELAESEAPDVALLDIGMPRLNGYQVAERLRASCPGTLLVAVSGWGGPADKQRAAAAGFHHHFVKPADFRSILQVLDSIRR
jgi:CheY-like chemotaxis protein